MLLQLFAQGESRPYAEIEAKKGERLSAAIWLSGKVPPAPLCSGLGLCGRCSVRYMDKAPQATEEDSVYFESRQLDEGWRLACHQVVNNDGALALRLELPVKSFADNSVPSIQYCGRAVAKLAYLGIDLGTTSIQWRAVDKNGRNLAEGSLPNPQSGAGADIISRTAYALNPEARKRLSVLVTGFIGNLLEELKKNDIQVQQGCIAANSAMTAILLQKDVAGFAHAPWQLPYCGNEFVEFAGVNFFIPPLFSPFVGGDTAAAILFLVENGLPLPCLLADLGTNAEFALFGNNASCYATSVPLGPALEGIGPACGQSAGEGVVTAFHSSPQGLEPVFGTSSPDMANCANCAGISATGYISLLAILLRLGVMRADGRFVGEKSAPTPLAARLSANLFKLHGVAALRLPCNLFLTSTDVELLLKVKAAFFTALNLLFDCAKTTPMAIASFCIAGALGENVQASDLETLGFFSTFLGRRLLVVGNAALEGSCILARQPEKSGIISEMRDNAEILNLAEDPRFPEEYLSAMKWGPDV